MDDLLRRHKVVDSNQPKQETNFDAAMCPAGADVSVDALLAPNHFRGRNIGSIKMHTRVTHLLGTRYPVLQAEARLLDKADFVASVSNAGGLGVLMASSQTSPTALALEIASCSKMTDQPFGVNLSHLTELDAYLDVVIKAGVPVVETGEDFPKSHVEILKRHERRVIHTCSTLQSAMAAERHGVDAVSIWAIGPKAGATGSSQGDAALMLLRATRTLRIPIIAVDDESDGWSMAPAFALGAEGVRLQERLFAKSAADLDFKSSGEPIATVWTDQLALRPPDIPSCKERIERIVADCEISIRRCIKYFGTD